MNEKMKQLAEQAWDATSVSKDFGHPVSFAEKLSELIVRECCDMIIKLERKYPANLAVREIKKEFGIKQDWD